MRMPLQESQCLLTHSDAALPLGEEDVSQGNIFCNDFVSVEVLQVSVRTKKCNGNDKMHSFTAPVFVTNKLFVSEVVLDLAWLVLHHNFLILCPIPGHLA